MSKDYIPQPDDKFDDFKQAFMDAVTASGNPYGLPPAMLTALGTAGGEWADKWLGFREAQTQMTSATTEKEGARQGFESLIRSAAQIIQNNPAITDAQRSDAGLPVYKSTRTPAPTPDSTPMLQKIDTSTRCILRLFFADSATPEKKAKPPGVQSCEIREQIGGAAPVDPSAMSLLAVETRAPYRADFEPMDVGKTVFFALRWLNTRGEKGPWSEIYSAVIPG